MITNYSNSLARQAKSLSSILFLLVTLCSATYQSMAKTTSPSLKLSPALTHVIVKQSVTASDVFTLTAGGSFKGNVSLSVSGLPSFVSASWSHQTVSLNSGTATTTLRLTPNATAPSNWYVYKVTAKGDGLTVTNSYTVEVFPSAGLQVSLSNPALTIEPLSSAALTVTATPIHNVKLASDGSGTSAQIVSVLPAGITAQLSPAAVVSGAANWTLTLEATSAAKTNADPIQLSVLITDQHSGLTYTSVATFPLLVSLLANVDISTTPGASIPKNFLGLSHEWGGAQAVMGDAATNVNYVYRQLLENLTAFGSGPLQIRIGGFSSDHTGTPTSTTVTPFVELANATGNHFTLGVNLGGNNVSLATSQAKAYASQMPSGSIEAIEIGNEPDLYYKNGSRPSNYSVQDYYNDFNNWKNHILPVIPSNMKVMGASWAYLGTLQANTSTYVSQQAPDLALFSTHCYGASPHDNPTVAYFLGNRAATFVPSQVAAAVVSAHAQGLTFRMGETGPISDGGIDGISNTFAAALWSIDNMFEYIKVGVDGVNWIASQGDHNDPFHFTTTTHQGKSTYALDYVSPLYYAMIVFQRAMGDGARMLPVTLSTEANLKAWATLPNGRAPRAVLINKDLAMTGNVAVSMPGYNHAQVIRLTAPSYTSTSGVFLGGKTLDGSTNGRLQGDNVKESFTATNGTFYIPMPVTSAAVVYFSH